MVSELKKQIAEWLTSADTCFLLGAGCSVCADKTDDRYAHGERADKCRSEAQ